MYVRHCPAHIRIIHFIESASTLGRIGAMVLQEQLNIIAKSGVCSRVRRPVQTNDLDASLKSFSAIDLISVQYHFSQGVFCGSILRYRQRSKTSEVYITFWS